MLLALLLGLLALFMPGLSNVVENKILDHLFNDGSYSVTGVTLAITSVAVTESDTSASITRVSYTGYADISVAAASMSAASGGSKTNSAVLAFPQNTGATTATAVGFAVLNSNGDILLFGTLPSTSIAPNITPEFAVGALVATAD